MAPLAVPALLHRLDPASPAMVTALPALRVRGLRSSLAQLHYPAFGEIKAFGCFRQRGPLLLNLVCQRIKILTKLSDGLPKAR